MNLLKLLGFHKKSTIGKSHPSTDILHLWEDDYLMIELLPYDNLQFVKSETNRINGFAQKNFDGTGFTDITPVDEKPVKTIDKLIDLTEVENIMTKSGLEKIIQFQMQGVGLLKGDKAPLGFGTTKFAVMCDKQSNLLKNIWLTGHTHSEEEKNKLVDALFAFGQAFNFIGVNWFKCEYYNLIERHSVEEFVKNSC